MKRVVSFLLALLFVSFSPSLALGETVLQLVPDTSAGFIRVKSLRGLSDDLKGLIAEMNPTGEEPNEDPLAVLLRGAFGGKYQSVSDLEKLGFDVKGDFAVVFSTSDLKSFFVLIGVSDRAKLEASLAALIPNPQPEVYSGAKYFKFGDGYYTILRGIFVFSKDLDSLVTAIDLYRHKSKPIQGDPEFRSLSLSLESDVTAFVNVSEVMGIYGMFIEQFPRQIEQSGGPDYLNSMLRAQGKIASDMMGQIHLLGMNVEIDGVEIRIDGVAKFKPDSRLANLSGGKIVSLDRFSKLPPYRICGVGDLKGIFTYLQDEVADELQMDEKVKEALKDFQDGVGDVVSFAVNLSGATTGALSDTVLVYEITDAERVNGFLEALPEIINLSNAAPFGPRRPFEVESVEPGEVEVYSGVEIKSLVVKFRRSDEGETQQSPPIPERMKIRYAIKDDELLYSESLNSNPIRDLLDAMEGGGSAADVEGFYEATAQVLPDPTTVILISPMGLVKEVFRSLSKTEQGLAAIYMLIQNAPEGYGMTISKSRGSEKGITRGRMTLSLEGVRQIFAISSGMRQ